MSRLRTCCYAALFLIVAAAWPGVAQSASPAGGSKYCEKLDQKGGFRDARLGVSFGQWKSLRPGATIRKTGMYEGVTYYTRSGDQLRLSEHALQSIEYGFLRGQLVAIDVTVEPVPGDHMESMSTNLEAILTRGFGHRSHGDIGSETFVRARYNAAWVIWEKGWVGERVILRLIPYTTGAGEDELTHTLIRYEWRAAEHMMPDDL